MPTYAIGDVHGCAETLRALLAALPLRPGEDRLWLVGDLVNRGPDSAGVLRWAREAAERMGERFVAVLGNHDVHLLARAAGVAQARPRDTLDRLLAAPDRDELVGWLRRRPLLHREEGSFLVHAGLLPEWTIDEAQTLAHRVEAALRGAAGERLLARYAFRGRPRPESGAGEGGPDSLEPLHAALAALTLLRAVDAGGEPCYGFTGAPGEAPPGCVPWFEAPGRKSSGATAVFGHWAALGLRIAPGVRALDTGCAWGGRLSALRLEDGRVWQVACRDRPK